MTTGWRWSGGRTATAATVAGVVAALALACAVTTTVAVFNDGSPDLQGAFCEKRGCCTGRQDQCSASILGTTCYCDDFCNHTRNDDCCPDYWSFCKGIRIPEIVAPIKQCHDNGRYYNYGETVKFNCNECQCRQESDGKMQTMCSQHECLIDPELLTSLKYQSNRLGWSVSNYSEFWGRRYDEGLSMRLGLIQSKRKILEMKPLKKSSRQLSSLPRSYDLRLVHGKYIAQPIDQGWCGSSWAITTAQVTTDRFAIMSKGTITDVLSPQHLLSCNSNSQKGCGGGHVTRAWVWVKKFGLVTEDCYPWIGRMTSCEVPKKKREEIAICPELARYGSKATVQLHRVSPAYRVATEEGIMHDILTSGSVQAMMKVTRDFFMYKSGVYKCTNVASGSRTGYHSVRIIGWGEEYQRGRIVKYWIVSNSWGQNWGEGGYFRIQRGSNECEIEDFVIAAWADVENINVTARPQGYKVFLMGQSKSSNMV